MDLCFCNIRFLKTPGIFVGFSEVQKRHVEFKFLKAVTKKSGHTVFWYVTPRNLVEIYRRVEDIPSILLIYHIFYPED
jgi:hypothetical protein